MTAPAETRLPGRARSRLARDLVPEEDPRLLGRFMREELRGLLGE